MTKTDDLPPSNHHYRHPQPPKARRKYARPGGKGGVTSPAVCIASPHFPTRQPRCQAWSLVGSAPASSSAIRRSRSYILEAKNVLFSLGFGCTRRGLSFLFFFLFRVGSRQDRCLGMARQLGRAWYGVREMDGDGLFGG